MKKLIFFSLLILFGCTSNINKNLVGSQASIFRQNQEYNPDKTLRYPLKMGLYFDKADFSEWDWTIEDKNDLQAFIGEFKTCGLISDVVLISDILLGSGRNTVIDSGDLSKSVRDAADRYNADHVLIVRGAAGVSEYNNPLSFLYITVVGLYLVPGTNYDSFFSMKGVMLDVAKGSLFSSIETDAEEGVMRPQMLVEYEAVIRRAKQKALSKFKESLKREFQQLRPSC